MTTKKSPYQRIPHSRETFIGYVVAVTGPLNIYVDIILSEEMREKYKDAIAYDYVYISEEKGAFIEESPVFSCHLKNVEICSDPTDPNVRAQNAKEATLFLLRTLKKSQNWVLVSVTDIDTYSRVLVNIFNIQTRKSINLSMIEHQSSGDPERCIARPYTGFAKRGMFKPDTKKVYYHMTK